MLTLRNEDYDSIVTKCDHFGKVLRLKEAALKEKELEIQKKIDDIKSSIDGSQSFAFDNDGNA